MSKTTRSIPCPYGPVVARKMGIHLGGTGIFAERDIPLGEIILREAAMALGYPRFFFGRVPMVVAENLDRAELERWTGLALPRDSAISPEFSVASRLLRVLGLEAGAWLTGRLEQHTPSAAPKVTCGAEDTHGLLPPLISDRVEDFLQVAVGLRGVSGEFSTLQIAELLGVVHKNAWTLRGLLTDGEYGYGLFHWGSLFNSSCAPNAIALFEGSQIVVRGLQPIERNDEITVAYNAIAPRHTLQGRTRNNFECACPRCGQDRAVQMSIPHARQESYFYDLAQGVTKETFWRIPEIARNLEVYQLLRESGIQELMTVAGPHYGRWDLAFLACEAYLRRVSVRGPGVPEPLQNIDPVSYTNVLLALVNAAWRCGVEMLSSVGYDRRRNLSLSLALTRSMRPDADLKFLRTLLEGVEQNGHELVSVVRDRDAELATMDVIGAYERLVRSTAEDVSDREARNILVKPLIAKAFAAAHLAMLKSGPRRELEVTEAFRHFLEVVARFLGPSDAAAIDAIKADAVLSSDVRRILDIYKRSRGGDNSSQAAN